jgi:protein SCO1
VRTRPALGAEPLTEHTETRTPAGPRLRLGRPIVMGAAVGLVAALILASLPRAAPPPPLHGNVSWGPGQRPAPPFSLRDQNGRAVSLTGSPGRVVLVTFMDSHCRKACPVEGRMLRRMDQSLAPNERPELMVVSINPSDTAASAQRFAKKAGFASLGPWHWLMAGRPALSRVWSEYGVEVRPTAGDIEHSTVMYLIDRNGDERAAYGVPFPPSLLASDVRALDRAGGRSWHWPWS